MGLAPCIVVVLLSNGKRVVHLGRLAPERALDQVPHKQRSPGCGYPRADSRYLVEYDQGFHRHIVESASWLAVETQYVLRQEYQRYAYEHEPELHHRGLFVVHPACYQREQIEDEANERESDHAHEEQVHVPYHPVAVVG